MTKVFIEAQVVQQHDGALVVRLDDGFANQQVTVALDRVVIPAVRAQSKEIQ